MNDIYKNWIHGLDSQDYLSVFAEHYYNRTEADFVQLLTEPGSEKRFKNCYTYCRSSDFSYSNALQHKSCVENMFLDNDIEYTDFYYIDGERAPSTFLQELGYCQLFFIPVIHADQQIALLCIYFSHENRPDPALLQKIREEFTMVLDTVMKFNAKPWVSGISVSFTRELAFVRTRKQLAELLETQLKPLIGFNYSTILLLESESAEINDFFEELHVNIPDYPFVSHFHLDKASLNDQLIQHTFFSDQLIGLDFEQFDINSNVLPLLVKDEKRFSDVIIYNLYGGAEVIGKWIMLFNKLLDPPIDQELLLLTANLLTLSVGKILSYERLRMIECEREDLRSLAMDFSIINEKKALLNIFHQKLSKLFDFNYTLISLINDDETTVSAFLRDTNSRARNHPRYQEVVAGKFPIADGVHNKLLLSHEPITFDLDALRKRNDMPGYFQIMYESGIRRVCAVHLMIRSKVIGFWWLCYMENGSLTSQKTDLMKAVSVQLSIAVDNIKTNEFNRERESETANLFKLNFGLAKVRNGGDLQSALWQNLSKLLEYDEVTIMVVDGQFAYRTLIAISKTDSLIGLHYEEGFKPMLLSHTLNTDELSILDLSMVLRNTEMPEHLIKEYDRGMREKIFITLRLEENMKAIIAVNLIKKNTLSDDKLGLIKAVFYQIAFSINTILANEKIIKRQAERDLLLSLNAHISGIKTNDELLNCIRQYVQPTLGCVQTLLMKVCENEQEAVVLFPSSEPENKSGQNLPVVIPHRYFLNDGILNVALNALEPVIFNLDKTANSGLPPAYLLIPEFRNANYLMIAKLTREQKTIGFWLIFYQNSLTIDNTERNFIKGIAGQLSLALTNIDYDKRTKRQELENVNLFDFTELLSKIGPSELFATGLAQQFKSLFNIQAYVIYRIENGSSQIIPYLCNDFSLADLERKTWNDISAEGTCFLEEVIRCTNLVTFNPNNKDWQSKNEDLFKLTKGYKNNNCIGFSWKTGEKPVAVIVFWTTINTGIMENCNVWKSICTQLGIAISNMFANQQLEVLSTQLQTVDPLADLEEVLISEENPINHLDANYIIGSSEEMKKAYMLVGEVALTDSTVLILGETGTGKELIARAIHENSTRKLKPMIKVNCAALPANLIESELFGHERGAFTGALERRLGKFEQAHQGTLFLDEIGEMPLEMQVKLLRALQEKEIERIGGKASIKVNVRIVVATNRDLRKEMEEGRFRSDLFYRLNVFPIHLPALRHRKDDIALLTRYFIDRYAKKIGKKINVISKSVLQEMKQYHWPGNVRELEHMVERNVLMTKGEHFKRIDLPVVVASATHFVIEEDGIPCSLEDNERKHILAALKYCAGKINGKSGAATLLGVPASTLNSRMQRLNIKKQHFEVT